MTINHDHLLFSYHYELPKEYIAQEPVTPRDISKLLVVQGDNQHHHGHFRDLPKFIQVGDLLVLNNTRVMPARLFGHKTTGAPVEVLLLEEREPHYWLALVKPGKRLKLGSRIVFSHSHEEHLQASPLTAKVVDRDEDTGGRWLKFEIQPGHTLEELLQEFGHVPLPPYITDSHADPERYQTVYGSNSGSAAAPTAGLHFTPELLGVLKDQGVKIDFLTLHVGVGTFRPLESLNITEHKMHQEWLEVSPKLVELIQETKRAGNRVYAVGTTVARALESAAAQGELQPYRGKTDLYIYPGYRWRVVDGMITNFHLPRSSLLLMVSSLIGRERLLSLYQEAIAKEYRFYSFGDAMLITPEAVHQL